MGFCAFVPCAQLCHDLTAADLNCNIEMHVLMCKRRGDALHFERAALV